MFNKYYIINYCKNNNFSVVLRIGFHKVIFTLTICDYSDI